MQQHLETMLTRSDARWKRTSRMVLLSALVMTVLAWTAPAWAQGYPARPIRLVVPFPPGGAIDIVGRIVAQGLAPRAGQSVLVENRAGAGGLVGAEAVTKAPADGYTLCFCSAGSVITGPLIAARPPYDPRRDFAPVSLVASVPYLVLAHPVEGPRNIAELLARARQSPGALNYGSAGVGSTSHLAGALFVSAAGVDVVHVPHKGSAQAASELMAGRLQFVFEAVGGSVQYTQAGRLRGIGISTLKRSPMLPETPTIAEQIPGGFELNVWHSVMAPAATPRSAIDWLNREIAGVIGTAEVRERFAAAGAEPSPSTPEQLRERVERELARWEPVLTRLGLREK